MILLDGLAVLIFNTSGEQARPKTRCIKKKWGNVCLLNLTLSRKIVFSLDIMYVISFPYFAISIIHQRIKVNLVTFKRLLKRVNVFVRQGGVYLLN